MTFLYDCDSCSKKMKFKSQFLLHCAQHNKTEIGLTKKAPNHHSEKDKILLRESHVSGLEI